MTDDERKLLLRVASHILAIHEANMKSVLSTPGIVAHYEPWEAYKKDVAEFRVLFTRVENDL
jgi:hypothetical protein